MKCLSLAVLLATLPLAAAAQSVKVDFDKDADFSRYRSYVWSPAQEPVPNAANHVRITRGVEAELEARGLVKAETVPADLTVRYVGKIEKKVRGSSYSTGYWQPNDLRTMVDIKRVQEGTLIVELYDGSTKLLVWRSVATDTPASPDMLGQQIQDLVKKSFAEFPPKPKAE
jgi:uncharacterized protein DUF4136